jgi:exonuclease SbcC
MILKTLRVKNIRSYENHTIDFREGITLFEGDIGSGKSSILSAIEFALFGLGNQSGSHLLRLGETEGSVELIIEINEKDIKFGRSLKRKGKRITQETCYIEENEIKTKYNPTNMKKRALQILNFKEPTNPRSHSLIYRFAVFTPQEQMREVIRQKPDDRKQTLRKAFGVEEYNIASNNATTVLSTIRKEINALEASQIDVDILSGRIQNEKDSKEEAVKIIAEANKELDKIRKNLNALGTEISQKKEEKTLQTRLETKLSLLFQEKEQVEKRITENKKLLEIAEKNLKEAKDQKKLADQLRPIYRELIEFRKKNNKLQPSIETYTNSLHQIDLLKNKIEIERKNLEENYLKTEILWIQLGEQIEELDGKIEKISELKTQEEKLQDQVKKESSLQESNIHYQRRQQGLQQTINILESQKQQKQLEWNKIESIGIGALCPRCHQKLSQEHLTELETEYLEEMENINRERTSKLNENEQICKELLKIEILLSEIESNKHVLTQLQLDMQSLKKDKETRENTREQKDALKKDLENLKSNLKNDTFAINLQKQIYEQEEITNELKDKVKQFESNKKRINELEEKEIEKQYIQAYTNAERIQEYQQAHVNYQLTLSNENDELSNIHLSIYETERKLKKYEKLDEKLEKLLENEKKYLQDKTHFQTRIDDSKNEIKSVGERINQIWLRDFLIPSLQSIEKSVLVSLNQEFNKLFKKWFSDLIDSEEILGFINEDFTPIIEQGGYELDVESLSGGEKTSVALAYRLALNTIVKLVTDTMKSNLLILDEPTDGFSKDQLNKMREILIDLNCEQIIIVSHEQELENVADYIYKVTKDGNTAMVQPPQ